MSDNKCKFEFYLDDDGKPVIEAGNPDCQLLVIQALQGSDVTVKVTPRGAIAETEPATQPAAETEPATQPVNES